MFRTDKDRLYYGNILMPPAGYKLEKAVGTTYSLDLKALTAVVIALGLHEDTDSVLDNNPVCLLNAIQNATDKIILFCDAGQIKLPQSPSTLYILLEKMVVPVALPQKTKNGRYPSFHPKTWLLQYSNDKNERKYRFVVLSRNLNFDRSWDVSIVLDGSEQDTHSEKTQPVTDFLKFLRKQISGDFSWDRHRRNLIDKLCSDLENVSFEIDMKEFYDFEIMPLGIGKNQYDMINDGLFQDTFHELVIMSPFITAEIIESFNKDSRGLTGCCRTLITRKTEIGKLKKEQADNFDIYTLKDAIIDGEDALSGEDVDKQKQDIHAKIYIKRKHSNTELYIGSMNTTYSAVNENAEMMVKLSTKNRYLNGSTFLKEIFGGDADSPENPFERSEITGEGINSGEEEKDLKEQAVKQICRMKKQAKIVRNKDRYDLIINFESELNLPVEAVISPLRSRKESPLSAEIVIADLDILQLSEFYSLKVSDEKEKIERIIMIPTEGIPDNRESAVVNSIIKDRKSFLEYIAFVLGDDHILSFIQEKTVKESGFFRESEEIGPAIYGKMLRTSLNEPERLNNIEYVMKHVTNNEVIPDEFRKMYEVFKKSLKIDS